jgi:hypothetical protein
MLFTMRLYYDQIERKEVPDGIEFILHGPGERTRRVMLAEVRSEERPSPQSPALDELLDDPALGERLDEDAPALDRLLEEADELDEEPRS